MYVSIFLLVQNASERLYKTSNAAGIIHSLCRSSREYLKKIKNTQHKDDRKEIYPSPIVFSMDQTWLRPALIGEAATGQQPQDTAQGNWLR